MRRVLFLFVLALAPCLAFLLPERPARADQWQVLSPEEAQRARAALEPGALLVLHCSACRDRVEVLRVESAKVEPWDGDRGRRVLRVRGARLLRSEAEFAAGTYTASVAHFRAPTQPRAVTEEEVDLAYAYVQRGPNRFACLALELGLPTSDVMAQLALPDAAWQSLAASPRTAPAPTAASVAAPVAISARAPAASAAVRPVSAAPSVSAAPVPATRAGSPGSAVASGIVDGAPAAAAAPTPAVQPVAAPAPAPAPVAATKTRAPAPMKTTPHKRRTASF